MIAVNRLSLEALALKAAWQIAAYEQLPKILNVCVWHSWRAGLGVFWRGGHGFNSFWGLGNFLCLMLASCWWVLCYIYLSEYVSYLYLTTHLHNAHFPCPPRWLSWRDWTVFQMFWNERLNNYKSPFFAIEISLTVNSPTGQKLWKVLFLKIWFMNVQKDDKSS